MSNSTDGREGDRAERAVHLGRAVGGFGPVAVGGLATQYSYRYAISRSR